MTQNRSELARELRDLACLFLKLGLIGFGGPAAHVAMMEDEVVRRRQWLTREEFLDLLGATNLIPGPNSTEMAIHIGRLRAGAWGLVVAGACFILPAMSIVLVCAWLYVRYGTLPQAEALLYGVKPVIIAIVAQALWGLGKSALKNSFLLALAGAASLAALLQLNELLILFASGILAILWRKAAPKPRTANGTFAFFGANPLFAAASSAAAAGASIPFGVWPLFLFFLKVGSVLYGSGYVLLAFLRADLVERFGWLTETQLLDAIAVGQITPGPVFTTATFIGFLLGGVPAALAATVGIFLPAFLFVALSGPLIPRLRRSPAASAFLDGVNAASLALMLVVTLLLARVALLDWLAIALTASSAFLLFRCRVNSAWLVAGGAAVGLLLGPR